MQKCLVATNQQKWLLIGRGEAVLAKLVDVNEGGNRKSMYSALWFSNAIEDRQVENKMDCSKSVEQMSELNEANLKSLVEMPIIFSLLCANGVGTNTNTHKLTTPWSICNSKQGQTHDLHHYNQTILRVLGKQGGNKQIGRESKKAREYLSGRVGDNIHLVTQSVRVRISTCNPRAKIPKTFISEYFEDERIQQNVFTQGMPLK